MFSQYSSSACSYVIPHSAHMDHFNNIPSYQSTFSFKKITPTEVFNAITQLSLSRSAGHDGIESRYIKLASHILMYPLLTCSTCPYLSFWKYSRITPLYKNGDILNPNNYRPTVYQSFVLLLKDLKNESLISYHSILKWTISYPHFNLDLDLITIP